MGIRKEMKNNVCVLTIDVSRLDASGTEKLKNQIDECLAGQTGSVVLDLSKVDFLDSKGLSFFVGLHKNHPENSISLCHLSPNISRILEISRIDQFFRIQPDLKSAISDLT